MRFNRGPLGCLFGCGGCFTFVLVLLFFMAIMNGGLEELLEEIFWALR